MRKNGKGKTSTSLPFQGDSTDVLAVRAVAADRGMTQAALVRYALEFAFGAELQRKRDLLITHNGSQSVRSATKVKAGKDE